MSGTPVFRTVAPAKINWTLEVLGRRSDGYHEIRSVMQTISLGDTLTVQRSHSVSLRVAGPTRGDLAGSGREQNLVMQAAGTFPRRLAAAPVSFTLDKYVPVAAGLGGGSSDAAAALRLLARVWNLRDRATLQRAAAQLGSDVPFFLRGGAQLVAGRGDMLTPLPTNQPVYVVVLTPPVTIPNKTARLYAEVRPAQFTDGTATERLGAKLRGGGSPSIDDYFNVFDTVADRVFPWLSEYRRKLERATGVRALLAGAGPSLFAVVDSDWPSPLLTSALYGQGLRAQMARTIGSRTATQIESL